MLDGPLVFVDVDTQHDFLDPTGALYIAGSSSILPKLARLTQFAQTHDIPILATACAHTIDDEELKRFPPHCLVGTKGQERIPETKTTGTFLVGPGLTFEGKLPGHLTLEKHQIDFFSHPDAARLIDWYDHDRPTFI